jgi:hypothetical protein
MIRSQVRGLGVKYGPGGAQREFWGMADEIFVLGVRYYLLRWFELASIVMIFAGVLIQVVSFGFFDP